MAGNFALHVALTIDSDRQAIFGYLGDVTKNANKTGCWIAPFLWAGDPIACSIHHCPCGVRVCSWLLEAVHPACILSIFDVQEGFDAALIVSNIRDLAVHNNRSSCRGDGNNEC